MRIFKYHLGDRPTKVLVKMPKGAQILTVHAQGSLNGSAACLWAMIDETAETEERSFILKETGQSIEYFDGKYIGTAHLDDDGPSYVLHVFEVS